MISIDETIDEPNWLRYTTRLAGFCRLVRFDAAGLGLSDPLAPGTVPSIEGWGRRRARGDGCRRVREPCGARPARRLHACDLAGRDASRAPGVARHRQRDGEGGRGRGLRLRRADRPDRIRGADRRSGRRGRSPPGHRRLRPQPGSPRRIPGMVGPSRTTRSQSRHRGGVQPLDLLDGRALVPVGHPVPHLDREPGGVLRRDAPARPVSGRAHRRFALRHGARRRPPRLGGRIRLPRRRGGGNS